MAKVSVNPPSNEPSILICCKSLHGGNTAMIKLLSILLLTPNIFVFQKRRGICRYRTKMFPTSIINHYPVMANVMNVFIKKALNFALCWIC